MKNKKKADNTIANKTAVFNLKAYVYLQII